MNKLNIQDKITSFSYQKGEFVYLEEDCDYGTFYEAFEKKYLMEPTIKRLLQSNKSSKIRSYPYYKGE